jgi:hypothetical protein
MDFLKMVLQTIPQALRDLIWTVELLEDRMVMADDFRRALGRRQGMGGMSRVGGNSVGRSVTEATSRRFM